MKPTSSSESPTLAFSKEKPRLPFNAQTNKIGWLRATVDKPGATFDIVVRDGLGRVRAEKRGCKTPTGEFGELINLPTQVGENLEIEVENLQGAESVNLFVN